MKRRVNSLRGSKAMAVVFILFVSMLIASLPAFSKPGQTEFCNKCHAYPATQIDVTTNTTSVTIAPGGNFSVAVSYTGGANDGKTTSQIAWPDGAVDNALFGFDPEYSVASTSPTDSLTSTITAPATTGTYTIRVYAATGSWDSIAKETDYENILVTVTAPVHDVAITSVTPSTNNVLVGELVSINVTVKNEGGFSETFNVTTSYYNATVTEIVDTQTVSDLASGAEQTLTFTWNTTGVADGTYTLKAIAETVSGETDTNDNTFDDGDVTVTSVPVHDIAITNVEASPTEVVVGDNVTINVTAKNKGNTAETFNVSAYYDSVLIDTQTGVTLSAGVNTTLTFTWNTTGVDLGTYTISANATVVLDETNTTDNTRSFDGTVKVSSTTINCIVSPTIITLGENVIVSGSIAPPHNATVTLTYTRPDDTTVTRTVSSNSSGAYNDTYTPDQNGTWTVKASWPGDIDHPGGATSELQLFVVELIDTSSPTISIDSPAEGATTTRTNMTFSVFADDPESGIKKVELYIDGQFKGNMSLTGLGIYTLEVTGLDTGTHTWYAKAYNSVGLTNETPPRTFTIQIEEAKPDPSSYLIITIVMAIVITFIGVAAIWKLQQNRNQPDHYHRCYSRISRKILVKMKNDFMSSRSNVKFSHISMNKSLSGSSFAHVISIILI